MIAEIATVILAIAMWGVMFGLEWGNFWLDMTFAASLLAVGGLLLQRGEIGRIFRFERSHVVVGIASAAALYVVFWAGDRISAAILPFAVEQVGGIYGMKAQMNPLEIALAGDHLTRRVGRGHLRDAAGAPGRVSCSPVVELPRHFFAKPCGNRLPVLVHPALPAWSGIATQRNRA